MLQELADASDDAVAEVFSFQISDEALESAAESATVVRCSCTPCTSYTHPTDPSR